MADNFVKGFLFEGESGLKSGANLEDLVTLARFTASAFGGDATTLFDGVTIVADGDQNAVVGVLATANYGDGTVTNAKLASDAVTNDKISGGGLVPSGAMMPFGGVIANLPAGWLECDGSSLVRVDFSDLFDAIGIVWGTADAASFNLPDMRGRFPRGYDHGATIDPNAGTRTASNTGGATGDNVGSVQADVFGTHRHGITSWSSNGTESGWNVEATDNQQFGQTATDGFAVQDTGGAETRPKNASVMYIIKT